MEFLRPIKPDFAPMRRHDIFCSGCMRAR
jgi:hypothetical protein